MVPEQRSFPPQAAGEAKLDGPMEEVAKATATPRQGLALRGFALHPQLPVATDPGRHSSSSDLESLSLMELTDESPPTI